MSVYHVIWKQYIIENELQPLLIRNNRPMSSSVPNGPRIGCGSCYHTLDPNDEVLDKRSILRCSGCKRYYHAVCWPDHCLNPQCNGTEARPVAIDPPRKLQGSPRTATDFVGGGYPTLEDQPLGQSKDILFLNDTQPQEVRLINNTESSFDVPRILHTPWINTYLEEKEPQKVLDDIRLEPKDERRILFQVEVVRPPFSRTFIELHQGLGIDLVTTQGRVPFYIGLGVFALLLLSNWGDVMSLGSQERTSISAAVSLGLIFGYLALIAPSWARHVWLRGVRLFDYVKEVVPVIGIEGFIEKTKRFLVTEENPDWVTSLLHRSRRAAITAAFFGVIALPLFTIVSLLGASFAKYFSVIYIAMSLWLTDRWLDFYHLRLLDIAKWLWRNVALKVR
jgi:hypothetical protein